MRLQSNQSNNEDEKKLAGTIRDIFKIKYHRNNLLILIFIWMASSFNIYMLNSYQKYLPGNIFDNVLFSASFDLPMCVVGGFVFHKLGIKVSLIIFFIGAVIGSILLIFLGDAHPHAVPYILMIAR